MPLVLAHDLCSEQLEPRQFDDAMQFHVPRASLLLIASSVEREQLTTIRFGLLPICTGFRLGLSAARSGLEKLSVRAPASRMRFQWLSCHVSSSLFGHALSTKARLCKIGELGSIGLDCSTVDCMGSSPVFVCDQNYNNREPIAIQMVLLSTLFKLTRLFWLGQTPAQQQTTSINSNLDLNLLYQEGTQSASNGRLGGDRRPLFGPLGFRLDFTARAQPDPAEQG